jgi:hypothetical protein
VLAGAGMSLVLGPVNTDAVNHASQVSYGEVVGITQTVRNYAGSLGLAVLGTVLISRLDGDPDPVHARLDFAGAMAGVFYIMAALMAAAAMFGLETRAAGRCRPGPAVLVRAGRRR